jgi:glycerate dehydrogenase
MKAVFLDTDTIGKAISLDFLKQLPLNWHFYPSTLAQNTLAHIEGAEVVVTNKVLLSKEILEKSSSVKLICVSATGYNNIDLTAAKNLKVTVCNVPAYSTPSVIQHTWLLILALFSNLIPYAKATKEGRWQISPQFCMLDYPIAEIQGKTLGIVGFGHIGKAVAKVAAAFGMHVVVAQHSDPERHIAGALPLDEVLKKADVITFHAPLTSATKNLITTRELKLMKPSAFLVNVARGGIINEADLSEALKKHVISGAALDVLSTEPPSASNPLLQKDVPNLILTPHIAWAGFEARERLLAGVKENIEHFLRGNPQNVVS